MRSPLEHEPDLVAGIGLITVRWALLDNQLAELLAAFTSSQAVGRAAYHTLSNFSQRIDLIDAAIIAGLLEEKHQLIGLALTGKIKRLWKKRNYLIHSHYVHSTGLGRLIVEGRHLGKHPNDLGAVRVLVEENGTVYSADLPTGGQFGYQINRPGKWPEFVPVNIGSMTGHADAVSKRVRQVGKFTAAIDRGLAPLIERDATSFRTRSPRQPRGLRQAEAIQGRQVV